MRRKIAIIGYTDHRAQAPYADPEWELWGLNDLYYELPAGIDPGRWRWFQLHPWAEIAHHKPQPVTADPMNFTGGPAHPRDPNHVLWLQQTAKLLPLYMLEARPEVPEARLFPKDEAFRFFSLDGVKPFTYFTNSISWMLALAIMELCPDGPDGRAVEGAEIGVYGVDMMMAGGEGSEYGYQRPSCEFFIGWARAHGIRVHLPAESDLLASAYVYGDGRPARFRLKVREMATMYRQRLADLRAQNAQIIAGINNLTGALDSLEWIERSWMPGDSEEPRAGRVPMPNAHKELATPFGTPKPQAPAPEAPAVNVNLDLAQLVDPLVDLLQQRGMVIGAPALTASDSRSEE